MQFEAQVRYIESKLEDGNMFITDNRVDGNIVISCSASHLCSTCIFDYCVEIKDKVVKHIIENHLHPELFV